MLYIPKDTAAVIKESDYAAVFPEIERELEGYAHKGTVESFDGLSLNYEYYLAENAVASIVAVHGFTEFIRKYREAAYYFLNAGYNVFLYDQRGHGLSGREVEELELCHIDSFDSYVRDLECLIDRIVRPASDAPIYLFSHSMGGAVSLLYLQKHGDDIKKAVLSSPMVCPRLHGLPRLALQRRVSRDAAVKGWAAAFRYASHFDPEADFLQSSDASRERFKMNLEHRKSDRHYQNSTSTNGWMRESLTVYDRIMRDNSTLEIGTEILMPIAGKDTVVRISPQKRLARRLKNANLLMFKSSKHTVFHGDDGQNEKYWKSVLDFYSALED